MHFIVFIHGAELMLHLVTKATDVHGGPSMTSLFFMFEVYAQTILQSVESAEERLKLYDCVLDSCFYSFERLRLEEKIGSWVNNCFNYHKYIFF